MAKVVPSGVLQLPDFAQINYNLKEKQRQEMLQMDDYLSKFQEQQGNYLAADLQAVQEAYDNVEDIMDKASANPNDPAYRRELRNAYGNYSQLAGTARFLADNNRQQRIAYQTNPDNFSMASDEAMGLLDTDARTLRSSDQILSLAGNPFMLQSAYKYQLGSPTEVADEMFKDFSRVEKDYINNDGSYDQDGIEQWGNEWLATRYIDSDQRRNAIGYSALREGKIGKNGKLTGRADLDRLDSPEFESFIPSLLQNYNDQTMGAFKSIIPKRSVSLYDINQDALRLAATRNKAIRDNKYFNLTGGSMVFYDQTTNTETGEVTDKTPKGDGYMYPIEDIPVKTADGDIISFGKLGDEEYVTKLIKKTTYDLESGKNVDVFDKKTTKASTADKAAMRRSTEGLYDLYIEAISYTGDKKKQEQKPAQRVADFDLASGMAFTAEENSNNEMMSYSDVEQAIPNLTPQEFYMPASASNLQSGAFLTSEQRAQRDAAAKRSRDALGITIIP